MPNFVFSSLPDPAISLLHPLSSRKLVMFFNLHQSSSPNIRFTILILIEKNKRQKKSFQHKKRANPNCQIPSTHKTHKPNFLLLSSSSKKEKGKARNPNIKANKKQVQYSTPTHLSKIVVEDFDCGGDH